MLGFGPSFLAFKLSRICGLDCGLGLVPYSFSPEAASAPAPACQPAPPSGSPIAPLSHPRPLPCKPLPKASVVGIFWLRNAFISARFFGDKATKTLSRHGRGHGLRNDFDLTPRLDLLSFPRHARRPSVLPPKKRHLSLLDRRRMGDINCWTEVVGLIWVRNLTVAYRPMRVPKERIRSKRGLAIMHSLSAGLYEAITR